MSRRASRKEAKARSKLRHAKNMQRQSFEKKLRQAQAKMSLLQKSVPVATGCDHCAEWYGEEKEGWCCREICPDLWFAEFKIIWDEISRWPTDRLRQLIKRTVEEALKTKGSFLGCPFYDGGCSIYNCRPLSCREFGVQTEACFNHIAEMNKPFGFVDCEQCNKLTVSGDRITIKQSMQTVTESVLAHKPLDLPLHEVYGNLVQKIFQVLNVVDIMNMGIGKRATVDQVCDQIFHRLQI